MNMSKRNVQKDTVLHVTLVGIAIAWIAQVAVQTWIDSAQPAAQVYATSTPAESHAVPARGQEI
jgi:hypothetical protein